MGFFNLFSSHKETTKQPQQNEAQFQSTMFSNLNQTQKYAMLTMLISLAAAPANAERTAMAQKLMLADAAMMGITLEMMQSHMQTHTRSTPEAVISTLRTISDANVLEWLIYCGFGIIAVNQNEKACYVFYDWWKQLGYEPKEIDNIVNKLETICNEIYNL